MTTTRTITWLQIVLEANPEHYDDKRKEEVYEFSNGRKLLTTDHTDSGIYDGS